ncbi:uncharacterized protein LOC114361004, partial [Ostrinia furnacalis]|uniref:uncharacterized protein LOC114361004 n=1 Tax=Ostrinia furnacalis TaxID=93504 RepID=UPI00103C37D8
LEENSERAASALRAAGDHNLNPWAVPPHALHALLAHVSSGSSTRAVSPTDRCVAPLAGHSTVACPAGENSERAASALRAAGDHNLNPWAVPPHALHALLAHVSSGSSTRAVSPTDSTLLELRRQHTNGVREVATAPASPPDEPAPFQRNT